MEVEFITLGDASERLQVPPPTLRNWTDQLEEYNVHYVKRNNRNERIYYDSDLAIFKYIKELKKEFGRRTTMKDIVAMIKEDSRLQVRGQEDAPAPVSEPSNKTADLINADDVQRLMENERVRALLGYMIAETTKQLKAEFLEELQNHWDNDREALKDALRVEVKKEVAVGQEQVVQALETLKEEQKQRDEEQKEKINERDEKSSKELKEIIEEQRKALEARDLEQKKTLEERDIESMKLLKEIMNQQREENEAWKEQQKKDKEKMEKEMEDRRKESEARKEQESKGFFAKLFGNKS